MATLYSNDFGVDLADFDDESATYSITAGEVSSSSSTRPHLRTKTSAHAAVADVKVSFKRASGAGFDAGIVARSSLGGATSGTGSGYIFNPFSTSSIDVIRRIGGANTTISNGTHTVAHADGDTFSMEVTGTGATVTIVIYKGVVQIGDTITDTSGSRITAAGQTGLITFNSGSFMDDFLVEDVAPAAPAFVSPLTFQTMRTILRM